MARSTIRRLEGGVGLKASKRTVRRVADVAHATPQAYARLGELRVQVMLNRQSLENSARRQRPTDRAAS